jgi:hypothetical protein
MQGQHDDNVMVPYALRVAAGHNGLSAEPSPPSIASHVNEVEAPEEHCE